MTLAVLSLLGAIWCAVRIVRAGDWPWRWFPAEPSAKVIPFPRKKAS